VTAALWLLLAATLPDGVAPLGTGYPAPGPRVDVVLRATKPLVPGELVPLKLLVSDAATDAPVEGATVSLRMFGPQGSAELDAVAQEGTSPGHYLAGVTPAASGSDAFVVSVDGELVAGEGVTVAARPVPARRLLWPWALLIGLGLALARRVPLAALVLLCGLAGDARAHGTYVPPPAAIPGADVYVAQEIQFALGLRTAVATVEPFEAPDSAAAPRSFLAVPRSAIVERDGHELLFVRVAPERFVAREPRLGWTREVGGVESVAVLTGLGLDEKVVVAGAAFLRNGGALPP
jgi:hypothetical protein